MNYLYTFIGYSEFLKENFKNKEQELKDRINKKLNTVNSSDITLLIRRLNTFFNHHNKDLIINNLEKEFNTEEEIKSYFKMLTKTFRVDLTNKLELSKMNKQKIIEIIYLICFISLE